MDTLSLQRSRLFLSIAAVLLVSLPRHPAQGNPLLVAMVAAVALCTIAEKQSGFAEKDCPESLRRISTSSKKEFANTDSATASYNLQEQRSESSNFSGKCQIVKGQVTGVAGNGCEYFTDQNGEFKKYKKDSFGFFDFAHSQIKPSPPWVNQKCPTGSHLQLGIAGQKRSDGSSDSKIENVKGLITLQCLNQKGQTVGRAHEVLFERSSTFGYKIKGWVEGKATKDDQLEFKIHQVNSGGNPPHKAELTKVLRVKDQRLSIDHIGGYACWLADLSSRYVKGDSCDPNARIIQSRDQEVWCEPSALGLIKQDSPWSLRAGLLQQCKSKPTAQYSARAFKRTLQPEEKTASSSESIFGPHIILQKELFDENGILKSFENVLDKGNLRPDSEPQKKPFEKSESPDAISLQIPLLFQSFEQTPT